MVSLNASKVVMNSSKASASSGWCPSRLRLGRAGKVVLRVIVRISHISVSSSCVSPRGYCPARLSAVLGAASRSRTRLAKPLAINVRASPRVSPASRVSQHSNSRVVGSRPADVSPLTVSMRASGSIGKVTTDISQRSASRMRRTPLAGSLLARTARKPIDSPSSAPPRISAQHFARPADILGQPAAHEQAARILA